MLDMRASGDMDSSQPDEALVRKASGLPLHRYDWWATDTGGYPPFMLPTTENSKPINPDLLQEAAKPSRKMPPWKKWDILRLVTHVVIHFTPKQVEELRNRVNESPSRLDAVLAHTWSVINRARGLAESEVEVFLNLTMGVRARVDPTLPDTFLGSPLIMAHRRHCRYGNV
jgi:hypothetical protein